MNASQIHLALTHLPVVLSLVGMVALGIAFIRNKQTLRTIALYIIAIAGIASLPVFFSGEGAEEMVEGLPGVSEALIEKHESAAKLAFISLLAAGSLAMIALVRYFSPAARKTIAVVVLLAAVLSTGLMAQAAHPGGQIRHTEIRGNAAVAAGESGAETGGESEKENEENDD